MPHAISKVCFCWVRLINNVIASIANYATVIAVLIPEVHLTFPIWFFVVWEMILYGLVNDCDLLKCTKRTNSELWPYLFLSSWTMNLSLRSLFRLSENSMDYRTKWTHSSGQFPPVAVQCLAGGLCARCLVLYPRSNARLGVLSIGFFSSM